MACCRGRGRTSAHLVALCKRRPVHYEFGPLGRSIDHDVNDPAEGRGAGPPKLRTTGIPSLRDMQGYIGVSGTGREAPSCRGLPDSSSEQEFRNVNGI